MFVCPNCGANIIFDPSKQLLHCDYCETDLSPDSVIQKDDAEEQTVTESVEDDSSETGYKEYTTTIYTCKECGGEILANDNTVATFCSYCGASTVLASRVGKERAPEYIIPFKVAKDQCAEIYKKHLAKALYAPKYMKEDMVIDKFRGIYMPYWIYDFKKEGEVTFNAKQDHRSGDYIIHTNYRISTHVNADYNGLSYDASSQFSDALSEAIAPFNFNEAVDFNTSYMSGFYADAADVNSIAYEDNCRALVTNEIYSQITSDSAVRGKNVSSAGLGIFSPDQTKTQMGYFPVWFLSCRHKDRLTYAVVNGQTGEIAMDVPIDYTKYILSSLIIAAFLFVILAFIPSSVMRPGLLLVVSIIFAIVSMVIICDKKNKIYARENSLDDKGLALKKTEMARKNASANNEQAPPLVSLSATPSKPQLPAWYYLLAVAIAVVLFMIGGITGIVVFFAVIVPLFKSEKNKLVNKKILEPPKQKVKSPSGEKFLLCLKPLIGAVLAIGIWIYAPAADEYYYIAAMICIAGVLLSFFDITSLHNKLSTRALPQFDRRGGDE